MIIPDVNLLLYAVMAGIPHHKMARQWWVEQLGTQTVGLTAPVIFGFVRVSTNRKIMTNPLTIAQAKKHLDNWRQYANVTTLTPGPRHVDIAMELLDAVGSAGNLTTDAQIAAYAVENSATVHTADTDFARFNGISWLNPLTAT